MFAARAWRSPADVLPAANGQTPALAAACNALRARNQGAAAVRCAFACAANFTGDAAEESVGGDWESALYRGTAPTSSDSAAALKGLDAAVDAVGGELRRCVSVREHTERDSADDALAACCAASISIRNAPDFLDRVLEAAREA